MAYTRLINTTKKGPCYEIQVSRGRNKSPYTKRWYPKPEWSKQYTARELAKAAAKFEQDCHDGKVKNSAEEKESIQVTTPEDYSQMSLKEYAESKYLPKLRLSASANTIDSYERLLYGRIDDALGSIKLTEITAAQINTFLTDLQIKDNLSAATAIKYYTVLQSLFKQAYLEDIISTNPMSKVSRPKQSKDNTTSKPEAFTAEEIKRIIETVDKEPLIWKTFVNLMIDTGMRRGECCALQWKDINFDEGTITVSHSLNYTPETKVTMSSCKNGKSRTIDVSDKVLALLKAIKQYQDVTVSSEFVFTQNNSSEPMHPQSPVRYLKKLGEKAGVEDLHPHKLRHSFASIAITNGADVESVSEKIGHSDAGFTLKQYTHANPESIKKAGDIFRAAIDL